MRILYVVLLTFCVIATCGDSCSVAPTPGTYGGGFPVTSRSVLVDSAGNPVTSSVPAPLEAISGNWQADGSGAAGSTYNITLATDGIDTLTLSRQHSRAVPRRCIRDGHPKHLRPDPRSETARLLWGEVLVIAQVHDVLEHGRARRQIRRIQEQSVEIVITRTRW